MKLFPRSKEASVYSTLKGAGNRLLIVQYAGDYREAYYNLVQSGIETYYAQQYSVDLVANCKQKCDEVGTLIFNTDEVYDELLPNGVRSIGAGFSNKSIKSIDEKLILETVDNFQPTHLVLRTPHIPLLQWAIRNQVRCLVTLADSFQTNGFKQLVKTYLLTRLLNNPWIDWVGNHGINSSISLQKIGVKSNKIIPWDWPAVVTPNAFAPKTHVAQPDQVKLFFAGSISHAKGFGDGLRAIPKLQQRGITVSLKAAGKGEIEAFKREAKRLDIESNVEFLGMVPHNNIVRLMREADVVIIPSRHEYPEGLPMTIYEALCSRTPIVASDHPMFEGKLQHDISALIFPQGDATALANCVERLILSPLLYQCLSTESANAWEAIQIAVKWGEIIERWLDDTPGNRNWLANRSLASDQYRQSLKSSAKSQIISSTLPALPGQASVGKEQ